MAETITVVIPAAGQGRRLERDVPKAAVQLNGEPLITRTVRSFLSLDRNVDVMIVEPPDASLRQFMGEENTGENTIRYVDGGASRYASVRNGVRALSGSGDPDDPLLIHDAARPFVTQEVIRRVLRGVKEHGAVIPVLPIPDTVKRVEGGEVLETVDREELFRAQTPQGFRRGWYEEALEKLSLEEGNTVTDDAGVAQAGGHSVSVVEGDRRNFKITYPEDLKRAEELMERNSS